MINKTSVKQTPSRKDFYFNAIKGRPSAEVFHGIFCVYSLLEKRMDEFFRPHNLTPVKFNALMLIKFIGQGRGISQNDLGYHLIVSPSNITRLLDRMAKDGYISRVPSEHDRRVNLIHITPEGEAIVRQVFFGFSELIQQSVYLLEREEVEQLAQLLMKWFFKMESESDQVAANRKPDTNSSLDQS